MEKDCLLEKNLCQLTTDEIEDPVLAYLDLESEKCELKHDLANFCSTYIAFEGKQTEELTKPLSLAAKKTVIKKKESNEQAKQLKAQRRLQIESYVEQIEISYFEGIKQGGPYEARLPQFRKAETMLQLLERRSFLLERKVQSSNSHLMFSKLSPKEIEEEQKRVKASKRLQRQLT